MGSFIQPTHGFVYQYAHHDKPVYRPLINFLNEGLKGLFECIINILYKRIFRPEGLFQLE